VSFFSFFSTKSYRSIRLPFSLLHSCWSCLVHSPSFVSPAIVPCSPHGTLSSNYQMHQGCCQSSLVGIFYQIIFFCFTFLDPYRHLPPPAFRDSLSVVRLSVVARISHLPPCLFLYVVDVILDKSLQVVKLARDVH
jgi:hypothetical protein